METEDYTKLVPFTPPDGLIDWMRGQDLFNEEFIVYKQEYITDPLTGFKEKKVWCKCTACGEEFYLDKAPQEACCAAYAPAPFGIVLPDGTTAIAGNDIMCPSCGEAVELIHSGQCARSRTISEHYPLTVGKVNERLVLSVWYVQRQLDHNANTRIYASAYEAYVVHDRKLIKLAGYQRFMNSISWYGSWQQRQRFYDGYGHCHINAIMPFDAAILNGTTAENSKLDLYIRNARKQIFPITYMNLWVKHKNVENLIMQGMVDFVNGKIHKHCDTYYGVGSINSIRGINFKAKRPHEMLGFTIEEFRTARGDKWDNESVDFYIKAKEYGVKPEDIAVIRNSRFSYYDCERLLNYSKNLMKDLRYLGKQIKRFPNENISIDTLKDYRRMMQGLGEDIYGSDSIMYPKNIVLSHDRATLRIEYKKSEELQAKFDKRLEELDKYSFERDGLIIRPAQSQLELVEEGRRLNHCVGGYAKDMAIGKTAIFFIRHSDAPDISYFTLELDEKNLKVRQNRGERNCSRTDEVKAFEAEWLEYIKEIRRTENGKRNNKRRDKRIA